MRQGGRRPLVTSAFGWLAALAGLLGGAYPSSPASAASSTRIVRTVQGNDWSLPPYARLNPYSGYITWSRRWAAKKAREPLFRDGRIHCAVYAFFTWNEINPAEGTYDWKYVDREIAKVSSAPGVGFVFWINAYNKTDDDNRPGRPGVPPWVAKKGKLHFLSNGTVAAWEPGSVFQKYYGKMIRALGRRYRNHPKLIGVDMRGLDPKWGEWTWRGGRKTLEEAEARTGLTPDTFRAWGRQYLEDFLKGFQGQEKKLAWMNNGPSCIWTPGMKHDYGPASRALWQYACAKGGGGRDGMVEVWNGYLTEGYGMNVTSEGYLEVNEKHPPIRDGALWYTENESYFGVGGAFGGPQNDKLRWFVSNMRTLQMRRNWIWPNAKAVDGLLPAFNRYVALSLGKKAENSPDAWCWLREGYLADWRKNRPLKNFERWLFQRDIQPGGVTVPEVRVDISELGQEESGKGYEFHARRTDAAHGNRFIYFRAAPNFAAGGPYRMQVKVTYLDGPASKWCLEYAGRTGAEHTPPVETTASGSWKTLTLDIPGMRFVKAFAGKMDFRIACLGPGDVTFRLVRVIKQDPPGRKTPSASRPVPGRRQAASQKPKAKIAIEPQRAALLARLKKTSVKKKVRVFLNVLGRGQSCMVRGVDERGIHVEVEGNTLPLRWKDISNRDLVPLGWAFCQQDAQGLRDAGVLAHVLGLRGTLEKIQNRLYTLDRAEAQKLRKLISKNP